VHVIPHGVLEHLAERPPSAPAFRTDGRVVLFFGLLRPYKGIDVLLEAWREGVEGAELWIVGPPRMDIATLRAAAPPGPRLARGPPGARALRAALLRRGRAAGLLRPRRSRRAPIPGDRAVGRAIHGARLRQAAAGERRGWLRRGGRRRARARGARGRCGRAARR